MKRKYLKITGNEEIPFKERKYTIVTWLDTNERELIWGYRKYRKPEGVYNYNGRLYRFENI